jgi:hypothetical protein
MLAVHVRPALGKRKVSTLAYSDVDALHREITKGSGPYRANRVIALLSKLCSISMQWHWRTDNPCKELSATTRLSGNATCQVQRSSGCRLPFPNTTIRTLRISSACFS